MGAKTLKMVVAASHEVPVQTEYSLPDDAYLFEAQRTDSNGVLRKLQLVIYDGSPVSDTSFINLDKGAVVFDTSTPGMHIKTAAKGTNTWKSETFS
jgi:hypothetical protein